MHDLLSTTAQTIVWAVGFCIQMELYDSGSASIIVDAGDVRLLGPVYPEGQPAVVGTAVIAAYTRRDREAITEQK